MSCPFCSLPEAGMLRQRRHAFAMLDAYPVSKGHVLIIPRRHVASWFDITGEERAEMLGLVDEMRAYLQAAYAPDGYNLGINDGATTRHS